MKNAISVHRHTSYISIPCCCVSGGLNSLCASAHKSETCIYGNHLRSSSMHPSTVFYCEFWPKIQCQNTIPWPLKPWTLRKVCSSSYTCYSHDQGRENQYINKLLHNSDKDGKRTKIYAKMEYARKWNGIPFLCGTRHVYPRYKIQPIKLLFVHLSIQIFSQFTFENLTLIIGLSQYGNSLVC